MGLNVCILYGRTVVIYPIIIYNILSYIVWLDMFCIPLLSGCRLCMDTRQIQILQALVRLAEMSYEMLNLLMHLKLLTYLQG